MAVFLLLEKKNIPEVNSDQDDSLKSFLRQVNNESKYYDQRFQKIKFSFDKLEHLKDVLRGHDT